MDLVEFVTCTAQVPTRGSLYSRCFVQYLLERLDYPGVSCVWVGKQRSHEGRESAGENRPGVRRLPKIKKGGRPPGRLGVKAVDGQNLSPQPSPPRVTYPGLETMGRLPGGRLKSSCRLSCPAAMCGGKHASGGIGSEQGTPLTYPGVMSRNSWRSVFLRVRLPCHAQVTRESLNLSGK